ncbi:hypothetical protein NEOLEDRAFT_49386 [Neolentinus lepideus HHB14362 ss-1]|uniref:Uncharacterized protein n=1 Tax=Neolentinus lepideus HHB14362 ss-1 TaxID=1314782 RepID=A0A165WBB5_9AGAM|nr:hypothetical protein NEOLEDRAFT_49386 [Neolentinus lepideus HHB14362 ss-1]
MPGGSSSAHIADQGRSVPSRRRARRSTQPISSSIPPSSSLLALIATVASPSSVDARPLEAAPLTFLYPFIEEQSSRRHLRPTRTVSAPDPPFPTPTRHQFSRRGVSLADKYASGMDGRWRRLSEYTLYGSTIVRSVPTAMPADDVADSTLSTSSVVSTQAAATSTSVSYDDLYDSLPYGWQPSNDSPRPTTIIAVLSVLLACLIIIVIGLSAYWRRRRRLARTKDPEKKLRRRADGEDEPIEDENPSNAQQIRSQKTMWVKATARWKANARQSFRRRRGRRIAERHPDSLRSSRRDLRDSNSNASLSRSRSRSPSMTSSSNLAVTFYATTQSHTIQSASRSSLHQPHCQSAEQSTTPPLSPPFPPAYYRTSQMDLSRSDYVEPSHLNISHSPFICRDAESLPPFSGTDDEERSLPSSNKAAHVATDDKVVLARMAAMSSAPPETDQPGGMSSGPPPHVPPWYDEDFEVSNRPSYDSGSGQESHAPATVSCQASSSHLPPPPTKAQLAASLFYEYPLSFEEGFGESEPSAPPFEECVGMPSAPPFELEDHLPSAPPLEDDVDEISYSPAVVGNERNASASWLDEYEGVQPTEDEEPRPPSRVGIGVEPRLPES